MMNLKELNIAIIGNRNQTALMRLAGIEKYEIIEEDDHDFREKIRKSLKEFSSDASIGIIMIPENWTVHAEDLVKYIKESKRITTIIVEFPSKFETKKRNVREYYKTYTRKLIGFNIEI